jgi:hypothetical protein
MSSREQERHIKARSRMSALLPESIHASPAKVYLDLLAQARPEPLALPLLALLVLGAVLLEARDWILRKRALVLEQAFTARDPALHSADAREIH